MRHAHGGLKESQEQLPQQSHPVVSFLPLATKQILHRRGPWHNPSLCPVELVIAAVELSRPLHVHVHNIVNP